MSGIQTIGKQVFQARSSAREHLLELSVTRPEKIMDALERYPTLVDGILDFDEIIQNLVNEGMTDRLLQWIDNCPVPRWHRSVVTQVILFGQAR